MTVCPPCHIHQDNSSTTTITHFCISKLARAHHWKKQRGIAGNHGRTIKIYFYVSISTRPELISEHMKSGTQASKTLSFNASISLLSPLILDAACTIQVVCIPLTSKNHLRLIVIVHRRHFARLKIAFDVANDTWLSPLDRLPLNWSQASERWKKSKSVRIRRGNQRLPITIHDRTSRHVSS